MDRMECRPTAQSGHLAVELILPGGSLLALLLWLYRHRLALRRHQRA
jgi:hypothetical protein